MLIGLSLAWMAALSYHDVRRRVLPNRLTIPGFAATLIVAFVRGHGLTALIGAVALALVYLLTHLLAPAEMGAGDVKLALGLGGLTACFGAEAWLLAAVGAPLLTALIGTVVRLGWSVRSVPHGPSMCAASVAAVGVAWPP